MTERLLSSKYDERDVREQLYQSIQVLDAVKELISQRIGVGKADLDQYMRQLAREEEEQE